ncbi:hypothetical protein RvY_04384 [Ramazzottius varieornatus]|uniref:BZIP domain-containing protein n=1 Tax=Ramazzottius varieornatus TaxID=947166 RepID=A0A1D1URH8_RAMVA|nr:hypothetical protein RvY_04384 [Ramazzottius varieornatus]
MEVSNAPNQPVISSAQPSTTSAATSTSKSGGGGKKRNLTLDLKPPDTSSSMTTTVSAASTLTVPSTSSVLNIGSSPGFVLTSPDVQMLQLASPELEKFIIQGLMGQNTPTPTQIVFPKNVTEEQESYAKGFVDALNALHRSGMAYNVNSNGNVAAFPISNVNGQNIFPQFFTMPQMAQQVQTMQPMQLQMTSQPVAGHQMVQLQMPAPMNVPKMEFNSPSVSPAPSDPQTVPSERGSTRSTNSSSGTSPINMESQSKMKVERKRERNRLAAAKCRMRKIERIAQLEERVKELKDQNGELANSRQQTQQDLANLRQELLTHLSAGCSLTIPQNLLQSIQQHQQETE